MKIILLIEDNIDIRENTAEILSLEGYNVHAVNTGEGALEIKGIILPDLILCDVVMPGVDGFCVYQAFKQDPLTNHIPFIRMTAKSENSDRVKAAGCGIHHYLVKPFDYNELMDCVNSCFHPNS